ncbi:hypothetical protein [Agromyces laixinhei]|uniref:hypothetical protein n=1 Tax=Agromyces laixinhei TaxID=2585717 RepID=UPI001E393400|nr:hypothetical protein [Agromyces laixinhei]
MELNRMMLDFDEGDDDVSGMLEYLDADAQETRVRRGDGRALEPYRWWQVFSGRTLFSLRIPQRYGPDSIYVVDVRLSGEQAGDEGERAHLYRDGAHVAESALPASFTVEQGVIEVVLGTYGLKRMHYVTHDRSERRLIPHPSSAVGLRLRLQRAHPALSRWIAATSIALLLIGVGVNVPQLVQTISETPAIAERFGSFVSPIQLPLWLNITLGVGAAVASFERGLRLRYNWLLDGLGN